MSTIKILIAEDNPSWQRILKDDLLNTWENRIYIKVVSSFNESLDALNNESPWDLFIIDLGLASEASQQSGIDDPLRLGIRLADRSRILGILVIIVSITATPQEVRDLLLRYQVFDFIDKRSYDTELFIDTVESALISATLKEDGEETTIDSTLQSSQGCFNWLHLTDLHRGMSQQSYLWQNIRQIFFNDLSQLHEECGPWDLVIFTGDLTQRGGKEEFEQVDELLEELWEKLQQLGSSPYLLAVPGNHDMSVPDESHRSCPQSELPIQVLALA